MSIALAGFSVTYGSVLAAELKPHTCGHAMVVAGWTPESSPFLSRRAGGEPTRESGFSGAWRVGSRALQPFPSLLGAGVPATCGSVLATEFKAHTCGSAMGPLRGGLQNRARSFPAAPAGSPHGSRASREHGASGAAPSSRFPLCWGRVSCFVSARPFLSRRTGGEPTRESGFSGAGRVGSGARREQGASGAAPSSRVPSVGGESLVWGVPTTAAPPPLPPRCPAVRW